jgi:hypothetical protein
MFSDNFLYEMNEMKRMEAEAKASRYQMEQIAKAARSESGMAKVMNSLLRIGKSLAARAREQKATYLMDVDGKMEILVSGYPPVIL